MQRGRFTLMNPRYKPGRFARINRSHPLARGLIGCWLLNEYSTVKTDPLVQKGAPLNIASKFFQTCTLENAPDWGTGAEIGGPALHLGTGTSDICDEGSAASDPLNLTGPPVSIVFQQYVQTAINSVAFTCGNLNVPNRCQSHAPFGDSTLYWDLGDNGAGGRISTAYTSFLGKVTHIALVGGSGGVQNPSGFQGIYINGQLKASQNSNNGASFPKIFRIGIGPTVTAGPGATYYYFLVYNRVLAPGEITWLYSKQLPFLYQFGAATSASPSAVFLDDQSTVLYPVPKVLVA